MADGDSLKFPEETEATRITNIRQTFFSSIGKCITFWAGIEGAIFDLFGIVCRSEGDIVKYIFWSIPTFSMRLSYASGITNIYLNRKQENQLSQVWKEINDRIVALYSIRNKLAHQPFTDDTFIQSRTPEGKILVLAIPEDNPRIIPNENDGKQRFIPIDNAMLSAHYDAISHLDFDLNNFIGEIRAMRELESLCTEREHKADQE